jgi:hypothetical protein
MNSTSSRRQYSSGFLSLTVFAALLSIAPSSHAQSANQEQPAAKDQPATQNQQAPPDKPNKKDKKSSEPATVKLRIEVVAAADGKPIGNASVYVRFNESGGLFHHDKLAELNFKTNQDGSAKVPEIPQGRIEIQVVAKGWHTFGQWYDVDTDEQTIQIKLAPPPHWY